MTDALSGAVRPVGLPPRPGFLHHSNTHHNAVQPPSTEIVVPVI